MFCNMNILIFISVFSFVINVTIAEEFIYNTTDATEDSLELNTTDAVTDAVTESLENSIKEAFDLFASETLNSLIKAQRFDTIESVPQQYHKKSFVTNNKGVRRLFGIKRLFGICASPIITTTKIYNGQTYVICVSKPTPLSSPKVTLGPLLHNGFEPRFSWNVIDPQNVVTFVDGNKDTNDRNLYVLTADAGRSDGIDLMVINHETELNKEIHTINSRYPTAVEVWYSITDNVHHLAIANSEGPLKDESFQSETYAYNWIGTYFDKYASMVTYYVRDICHFRINSHEFLAIANYKSTPVDYDVNSEIFKLNRDTMQWNSFQYISTSGAYDFEFFSLGIGKIEHFLVVANHIDTRNANDDIYRVDSVIYKYIDDKFLPFQCLSTIGATQMKSFRGPNGEFVLAISNIYESVQIYQYNGLRFIQTFVGFSSDAMSSGVRSLHFIEHTSVLIVSNINYPKGTAYQMDFYEERDNYGQWYNQSLEWCINAEHSVKSLNTEQLHQLNDVFFIDQNEPIVIENDVILNQNLIVTKQLTTTKVIDQSTGEEFSHEIVDDLMKLNDQLNQIEHEIDEVIGILSNALRTSGEHVITAQYDFTTVDFACGREDNCIVRELNADVLNGDIISNLANEIISLNSDIEIFENLNFEKIRVDNDIHLKGTLNGVRTNDFITKNKDHQITAPMTFQTSITASEVTVENYINGRIIDPTTVLLTNRDQFVNGTITFVEDVHVENLYVNGLINGLHLDSILSDLVTIDGNHVIKGEKIFDEIILNDLMMHRGATLDNIDMSELWDNVLWTYGNQEIASPIEFNHMQIEENLIVNGRINGLYFPENVLLVNYSAVINESKVFNSFCTIKNVQIAHSVNGLPLIAGTDQLDIMLKSRIQTVYGEKIFNFIYLEGHSYVMGTVDGVKLSQLHKIFLLRNQTHAFDGIWEITGDVIFEHNLNLYGFINGINLNDLYQNTLKLNESVIPSFLNIHMKESLFESFHSESINGINFGIDLMTKNTRQLIRGHKTFLNEIHMKNNFRIETINEINLSFFNDTLLRYGDQTVTGMKVFVEDVFVGRINVQHVNEIDMINDLVKINISCIDYGTEEVIIAPKSLSEVKVSGDVLLKGDLQVTTINDYVFEELFYNTLLYDKEQEIHGRLEFEHIEIPKDSNLDTAFVNNINLPDLLSDAVVVDMNQVITGEKIFVAPTFMDRVHSPIVDSVSEWQMHHNWMLQDSEHIIEGDVRFMDEVTVETDIHISENTINNIDILLLNSTVVKVDESFHIMSPIIFDGSVVVNDHIILDGRIQGLDLDKEVVTRDGNHQIYGHISFLRGFKSEDNLFVNGTIDGVNFVELCTHSVRNSDSELIGLPLSVHGNVIFHSSLRVNGFINGIDLIAFNRSVMKIDEFSVIKGNVRFKNLILSAPITVNGTIGIMDIQQLSDRYLSITKDQTILSTIVFHDDINFIGPLHVIKELNTVNGEIANINLSELSATAFKISGDQIIPGHFVFTENVYFQDLHANDGINGLNLNEDLMIYGRENIITVPKKFVTDLTVLGNLDIAENYTIQGVDISAMAQHTVTKMEGKFLINGVKEFNYLEVDHLEVPAINGIEFSPSFLLLNSGHQIITGHKSFENVTATFDVIADYVNGYNLEHLASDLVLKGFNNSITAEKTFLSFSAHNVVSYGKVDDVDLHELNYFVHLPVDLMGLRAEIELTQIMLNRIKNVFDHQSVVRLAYYEHIGSYSSGPVMAQGFNTFNNRHELFVIGPNQKSCECREMHVLSNDKNKHSKISIDGKLFSPQPVSAAIFTYHNHRYLVIANSKDSDDCIVQNPSLDRMPNFGAGIAITQVFVYDSQKHMYLQIGVIRTEKAEEIDLIENHAFPCILFVIKSPHSQIYCMNNGNFDLRENIPLNGIDKVSLVKSVQFDTTLMVAANTEDTIGTNNEIYIFRWSQWTQGFGDSIQRIAIAHPIALHVIESFEDNCVYLFIAERKISAQFQPLIKVFRYDSDRLVLPFVEVQQIKGPQITEIGSVYMDNGELYVFMLSPEEEMIRIYYLKGGSGFVAFDYITARGVSSFRAFNYHTQLNITESIDGHSIVLWHQKECKINQCLRLSCNCGRNILLNAKIDGKRNYC